MKELIITVIIAVFLFGCTATQPSGGGIPTPAHTATQAHGTGGLNVRPEIIARCSQVSTVDGQENCYLNARGCNMDVCLLINNSSKRSSCIAGQSDSSSTADLYVYFAECGGEVWQRDYCQYIIDQRKRACYSYATQHFGSRWCSYIDNQDYKDYCLINSGS